MVKHLAKSTDVVASNHKLIVAVGLNILLMAIFILYNTAVLGNRYLLLACALFWLASVGFFFYQIINRI